jgi:thiamine biosynthesis lipoprotein
VIYLKKIISFIYVLLSLFALYACNSDESTVVDGPKIYSYGTFDFMDTYISINFYAEDVEKAEEHREVFNQIYSLYHDISTGYEALSEDSVYLENIYSLNKKINQKVEIDLELYELLEKAEEIKILTNGYFDVSIGKIVDAWKEVILNEDFTLKEVSSATYDSIITKINQIKVVENPYILSIEDGKYFVEITDEDVKIDLGALSKGYATQKVYDYLVDQNVEYFSISAGSSSISIGKNFNRETRLFHITLANPVRVGNLDRIYGMIYLSDIGVNTSGNYEQYFLHNNLRYHHVVSPKTKLPMQYYHTVTIIGDDAGLLDALTTALFSMEPTVFASWVAEHQSNLGIEIIRFNYDTSIQTFLTSTIFEEKR